MPSGIARLNIPATVKIVKNRNAVLRPRPLGRDPSYCAAGLRRGNWLGGIITIATWRTLTGGRSFPPIEFYLALPIL